MARMPEIRGNNPPSSDYGAVRRINYEIRMPNPCYPRNLWFSSLRFVSICVHSWLNDCTLNPRTQLQALAKFASACK